MVGAVLVMCGSDVLTASSTSEVDLVDECQASQGTMDAVISLMHEREAVP